MKLSFHGLDVPSCIPFVRMRGGRLRFIDHNDAWPQELFRFENRVEQIVGVKKYVNGGEV